MLELIALFFISLIVTFSFQRFVVKMIADSGHISINYVGNKVPGIMGVSIVICSVIAASISLFFDLFNSTINVFVIFAASIIAFVGLLDDLLGSSSSKGFRGHIASVLKGELTTGGLKALVGGVVSFCIAKYLSSSLFELILNTFIIVLTTNIINLFDVRPGRAIKAFFILAVYLLITTLIEGFFIIVLASLLIYAPIDLRAKGMLGDTGSNFIGVILGTSIAMSNQNFSGKILFFLILVALNILSEIVSFSEIINKNRFLRYLDSLGVKGNKY